MITFRIFHERTNSPCPWNLDATTQTACSERVWTFATWREAIEALPEFRDLISTSDWHSY